MVTWVPWRENLDETAGVLSLSLFRKRKAGHSEARCPKAIYGHRNRRQPRTPFVGDPWAKRRNSGLPSGVCCSFPASAAGSRRLLLVPSWRSKHRTWTIHPHPTFLWWSGGSLSRSLPLHISMPGLRLLTPGSSTFPSHSDGHVECEKFW